MKIVYCMLLGAAAALAGVAIVVYGKGVPSFVGGVSLASLGVLMILTAPLIITALENSR